MSEDSGFVFDAVIGFLTSPIWNTPVPTFIEQHCLVFDPDEQDYESYKEIHEKYKQMVETLLSSFLNDIGITAEQFTAACKARGGNVQFNEIRKNVFEQVWAADDFEIFKRLMIQKNIELQLQALQLIQQHSNKEPAPSDPQQPNEEDAIMKEVLRLSKEEYDKKTKDEKKDEDVVKRTLAESFEEHESPSSKDNDVEARVESLSYDLQARLQMLAQREKQELDKAMKTCKTTDSHPVTKADHKKHEVLLKTSDTLPEKKTTFSSSDQKSHEPSPKAPQTASSSSTSSATKTPKAQEVKVKVADLPPLRAVTKSNTPADAAASWLNDAKAEATTSSAVVTKQEAEISVDEVKRRTEYLKQQRDKLLQMKKQQREKNLIKFTEDQPKVRPMSARAARRVIAGEQPLSEPAAANPPDDKKLAMRRALADVLKREVVEKQ